MRIAQSLQCTDLVIEFSGRNNINPGCVIGIKLCTQGLQRRPRNQALVTVAIQPFTNSPTGRLHHYRSRSYILNTILDTSLYSAETMPIENYALNPSPVKA